MPGLDRTGPRGEGPRTGRQMGKCAPPGKNKKLATDPDEPNVKEPQIENDDEFDLNGPGPSGRGFGFGAGRGFGRGTGRGTGRGMGRGVGRHRRRKRGN
ncbi:MAG: DUF5320 domain-containing protein [Bacteroidales bacterium]